MLYPYIERWPPVHDAEDLARTIRDLVESGRLEQRFYRSQARLPEGVSQGDIIELASGVPLIAHDGQPAVHDDVRYWMVIGNSCDIARSQETVTWSQIVPLVYLGSDRDLTHQALSDLRGYRYSRRFYVPPWSPEVKGLHHVADFLRPVAIHKTALNEVAEVQAGLEIYSWLLLHSCLVHPRWREPWPGNKALNRRGIRPRSPNPGRMIQGPDPRAAPGGWSSSLLERRSSS